MEKSVKLSIGAVVVLLGVTIGGFRFFEKN